MRSVAYAIGTLTLVLRHNERRTAMSTTIRARVRRGMLELLEKIDLPEGKEVTVTIFETPSTEDGEAFRRAAGTWKGHMDADALIKNIFAADWPRSRDRPLYALRGGLSGAGASSTDSNIAANIERGFWPKKRSAAVVPSGRVRKKLCMAVKHSRLRGRSSPRS